MASNKDKKQAQRMAEQGKSAKQIQNKTGVSAQKAQNLVAKAAPAIQSYQAAQQQTKSTPQVGQRPGETVTIYSPGQPVPQQAAAPQSNAPAINKQNTLGQNIRAAGANNGVLSEGELLKISKATGKSNEKVLEKAVNKGLMIGSKVTNRYQKGKYTDPRLAMARLALPEFAMATGKDNPILQQLRNAGKQDRGSALFIGSKGSTATTLPKRMGAGNMQQPTPTTTALPTDPGSSDPGTSAPVDTMPTTLPEQLPEEQLPPGPGMMSGGGLGALGANKLNRAKSRLRQLGIYGRGTGLLGRGLQYGNALNK